MKENVFDRETREYIEHVRKKIEGGDMFSASSVEHFSVEKDVPPDVLMGEILRGLKPGSEKAKMSVETLQRRTEFHRLARSNKHLSSNSIEMIATARRKGSGTVHDYHKELLGDRYGDSPVVNYKREREYIRAVSGAVPLIGDSEKITAEQALGLHFRDNKSNFIRKEDKKGMASFFEKSRLLRRK